eukprot:scaffold84571_cov59-Phaeocystis_antarctica.AAC.2
MKQVALGCTLSPALKLTLNSLSANQRRKPQGELRASASALAAARPAPARLASMRNPRPRPHSDCTLVLTKVDRLAHWLGHRHTV